jgi:hypothetical protein
MGEFGAPHVRDAVILELAKQWLGGKKQEFADLIEDEGIEVEGKLPPTDPQPPSIESLCLQRCRKPVNYVGAKGPRRCVGRGRRPRQPYPSAKPSRACRESFA